MAFHVREYPSGAMLSSDWPVAVNTLRGRALRNVSSCRRAPRRAGRVTDWRQSCGEQTTLRRDGCAGDPILDKSRGFARMQFAIDSAETPGTGSSAMRSTQGRRGKCKVSSSTVVTDLLPLQGWGGGDIGSDVWLRIGYCRCQKTVVLQTQFLKYRLTPLNFCS